MNPNATPNSNPNTSTDDFASQLTKLGLPTTMDAATLASKALLHNRRRIRSLAALTIGLWIVAFLVVPSIWMPFAAQMKRLSHELAGAYGSAEPISMKQMSMDLAATKGTNSPVTTKALAEALQMAVMYISAVSGIILAIMILAPMLAAISTIWLVLTVRRVTLEQLSMGLTQIAEELRRLRTPPA